MNKRFIYALQCPFTNDIHYIGKTTQGMLRPLQHLSNSHSEKVKDWVDELKSIGHSPLVKIIESVSSTDDLDLRERYWIQYYLNKNAFLLNSSLITPLLISKKFDDIVGKGSWEKRVAKFIKEKRKAIGITQPEFAEKCGISLKVLRKIEQGKTNYMLDGLIQILKMFGCSIDVCKI